MTDSVFVQELKKKARDKFGSSDKSSNQEYTDKNSSSNPQAEDPSTYGRMKTDASDIVDQYSRVTEWNNVFMTAWKLCIWFNGLPCRNKTKELRILLWHIFTDTRSESTGWISSVGN